MKCKQSLLFLLCAAILFTLLCPGAAAADRVLLTGAELSDAPAIVSQSIPVPVLSQNDNANFRIVSYQWYRSAVQAGCEAAAGEVFAQDTYYLDITIRVRNAGSTYINKNCYLGSGGCYRELSCTVDPDAGAVHSVFSVTPMKPSKASITLPTVTEGESVGDTMQKLVISIAEEANPIVSVLVYEDGTLIANGGFQANGSFIWSEHNHTFREGCTYTVTALAAADYYIAKNDITVTNPEAADSLTLAGDTDGAGFTAQYLCRPKPLPFTDLNPDGWYMPGIEACYRRGLMNGTCATTFEPSGSCTRAMIVAIVYRMAGSPEISDAPAFSDVPQGRWFSKPIAWAAENGIVKGYGGSRFGLNDSITREQLAVILLRYADFCGMDTTAGGSLEAFGDCASVSSWAGNAMGWCVGSSLINGKRVNDELCLVPQGVATRAECATIFMRFCALSESEES